MGKITVNFTSPLDVYLKQKKVELETDGPIKIGELESRLIEHFPALVDGPIKLKYIYYVVRNKTYKDKDTVINEGEEVMMYNPTLGG